jgi:hypothetical protein
MTLPYVVLIDDEPELTAASLAAELNKRRRVRAEVYSPGEITHELLAKASLVLVDYQLEVWPGRAQQKELALMPINGLALSGVLREYCEDGGTAIALLSNQLNILFGGLSPENRRHVLARVTSLEWVFGKTDESRIVQIEILAAGMQRVRELTNSVGLNAVAALLTEEQQVFVDDSWEAAVDRCLPPVNELAQLTHGSAFARWFLQRVLPYPTFLIDANHLAARLQITVDSLEAALTKNNELSVALARIEYHGVFGGFLGRRWHKSFLEDWLWEVTNKLSFDSGAVDEAVKRCSGGLAVPTLARPDPVVVVGNNYESTTEFVPRGQCIAIFPDDWPAYADRAYAKLDDVKEDHTLKKLVMHDERWRLEEG